MQDEHLEAPRFAFFLIDTNEIVLFSDYEAPPKKMSFFDFSKLFWGEHKFSKFIHFPRFICFTTFSNLENLKENKVFCNILYHAQCYLDGDSNEPFVSVYCGYNNINNFKLNFTSDKTNLEIMLLFTRLDVVSACVNDESTQWIDDICLRKKSVGTKILLDLPYKQRERYDYGDLHRFLHYVVFFLKKSNYRKSDLTQKNFWRSAFLPCQKFYYKISQDILANGLTIYPATNSKKKQLGIILPLVSFGGVEKISLNVALILSKFFDVHLFVLARNEAIIPKNFFECFSSINILNASGGYSAWHNDSPFYAGTKLPYFQNDQLKYKILAQLSWLDIVISSHAGALLPVIGDLKKYGVKTLDYVHVVDRTKCNRPVGYPFLTLAYENSFDKIIVESLSLENFLHGLGVPREKIIVVPNCPGYQIDDSELKALRSKRDYHKHGLNCLFIGRLDFQKGLDRISSLYKKIKHSNANIKFRLVGDAVIDKTGDKGPDLDFIVEPSVHENQKLNELYMWADIVVLLSRWEGLPLTILEAMRLGSIVITTNVGAISDVISHGINGFLLGNDVVDECFLIITHLLHDKQKLKQVSEKAIEISNSFTWDRSTSNLLDYLLSVK